MMPSRLSDSSEYASLNPFILDLSGAKHIPKAKLLDIIRNRAKILLDKTATPNLEPVPTEFYRGRLYELKILLMALQEDEPGLVNPNEQIPSGAENV